MKITLYQVDAFTDKVFGGNPAAVCPLKEWLDDEILLKIAAENNLSETAFYVPKNEGFEIRWFTPEAEVDLCGHATLAAAFVLFDQEKYGGEFISFDSPRSGNLYVAVKNNSYTLNFPVDEYSETELTEELKAVTDRLPVAAFKGKTDYMLVFEQQEDIKILKPDLSLISKLNARGVIVTSKGSESDFVSRFFAPGVGVNEDPVCGSAHTTLTPYWSGKLGKDQLTAVQLSKRGGVLKCRLTGDRAELEGNAVLYLKGEIYI